MFRFIHRYHSRKQVLFNCLINQETEHCLFQWAAAITINNAFIVHPIVPFQLFETAKVLHPGGSKMVQFVTFPSGHGHKHIHKSPKLPQIIR